MRLPPESKTPLWRSSRWWGRGCWVNSSRASFMWFSLLFGGKKGALLTACWTTTVRSGAIRPRRDGRFSATLRAEGGTHRPCVECIDRTGAVQKEGYVPKYVEGEFCELHTNVILGSFSSPCMPSYWPR